MRGTVNSTTSQQQAPMSADDHRLGLHALSPMMLLCLVVVTAIAFWFFTQLQITSTEQSVFGLLQIGVQLQPGMTMHQVQEFMSGNLDRYNTIADAIGWGVQIALLMLSFPPDSALLSLHRKYNKVVSPSLVKAAAGTAKLRRWMMIILIGGDVVTDFVYVAQGHTLVTMNGWLPTLSSGSAAGVILVGILYPTAICFVTVFVAKYMFVFLEALFEKVRGMSAN